MSGAHDGLPIGRGVTVPQVQFSALGLLANAAGDRFDEGLAASRETIEGLLSYVRALREVAAWGTLEQVQRHLTWFEARVAADLRDAKREIAYQAEQEAKSEMR